MVRGGLKSSCLNIKGQTVQEGKEKLWLNFFDCCTLKIEAQPSFEASRLLTQRKSHIPEDFNPNYKLSDLLSFSFSKIKLTWMHFRTYWP